MMTTLSLSAFEELLLSCEDCFSKQSFENFQALAQGWIRTTGRKTVTNMIRASGMAERKHHSAFHNFFSRAEWRMEDLWAGLRADVVESLYPGEAPVMTCGDDTLYARTGRKTYGTGIFRDPLLSSAKRPVFRKGHNWITFGAVASPECLEGRAVCLPLDASLYLKEEDAQDEFETRSRLMLEMMFSFASHFPERVIYHAVDGAYANRIVVGKRPENVHVVGRIRCDAELYARPTVPLKRGPGAPRKKGERLPAPQDLVDDDSVPWHEIEVFIYGKTRKLRVKEIEALWYRVDKKKPLRIVVVQDSDDERKVDYFFCTDLERDAEFIIEAFAGRWSIELMHRDSKQLLGVSDAQARKEKAVGRLVPFGFFLMSNIILWYIREGAGSAAGAGRRAPWYRQKRTPSFADMLAALRRLYWRKIIYGHSSRRPSGKNPLERILDVMIEALARAS